ncbi:MAG: cellulose biosynthesis protein BcsS [Methyloceanibacter sp.]|nr:cellulose biosynthesis protein BcsS [Methyloceanibacter sp.]
MVAPIPGSILGAGAASAEGQVPRREVFSGVETGSNYTTVYAGCGYAFGKGFDAPGWRVRAVGAWGAYHYDGALSEGSDYRSTTFNGQVAFLAAQVGYQFNQGRTIAKAFIGMEAVDQAVRPFDPSNSVQGTELGLRLTLETWTDISDRWFLSADGAYGTAFQEYWQLTRIGYRLGSILSVGVEGGVLGNQEYDAARGGGFVRGKFNDLEATVSGGFTGDYLLGDPSGYASVSVYRRF